MVRETTKKQLKKIMNQIADADIKYLSDYEDMRKKQLMAKNDKEYHQIYQQFKRAEARYKKEKQRLLRNRKALLHREGERSQKIANKRR